MPKICFFLVLLTASTASASAGLIKVKGAIGAVRKAGGPCKDTTLDKLKDARDALEIPQGTSYSTLKKARRAVEDALDDGQDCDSTATAAIQSALDAINSSLKGAADRAAQPSPAEKKRQEMRQCWNYKNDWTAVDPACHAPRKGNYPMSREVMNAALGKIRRADDRFDRTRVFNREIGYKRQIWISIRQLDIFLASLLERTDRLEAVKQVAGRIVDPKDGGRLSRHFPDKMMRKDAMQMISAGGPI